MQATGHFHFHELTFRVRPCYEDSCELVSYETRNEATVALTARQEAYFLRPQIDIASHDRAVAALEAKKTKKLEKLYKLTDSLPNLWISKSSNLDVIKGDLKDLKTEVEESYPAAYRTSSEDTKAKSVLSHATAILAIFDKLAQLEKSYSGWSRYYSFGNYRIHSKAQCYYSTEKFNGLLLAHFSGLNWTSVVDYVEDLCPACFPVDPPVENAGQDVCGASGEVSTALAISPAAKRVKGKSICIACGQRVTTTKTGKLRKHMLPTS